MIACITKLLERLGIIDHVEDTSWNTHGNTATGAAAATAGTGASSFGAAATGAATGVFPAELLAPELSLPKKVLCT